MSRVSLFQQVVDGYRKMFFGKKNDCNIITFPWIPTTDAEGNFKKISLLEFAINGKKYSDFVCTPMEKIAMQTTLICLMQDALDGPESNDEKTLAAARKSAPKKLQEYFSKYGKHFNLYDKNAWLQMDGIEFQGEKEDIDISYLNIHYSNNNNPIHFDHNAMNNAERDMADDERILSLLCFIFFGVQTKSAACSIKGQEHDQVSGGTSPMTALTCPSGSPLVTFIKTGNIFDDIFSNLLSKNQIKAEGIKWGVPLWRKYPKGYDDVAAIANARDTYLGRLIPLSRIVKLQQGVNKFKFVLFDKDTLEYSNYLSFFVPYFYKKKEDCWVAAKMSSGPQVWRDLPAIFGISSKNDSAIMRTPLALDNMNPNIDYDIWVGGYLGNKIPCTSFKDEFEGVYHIPAGASRQKNGFFLQNMRYAQLAEKLLKNALSYYYSLNQKRDFFDERKILMDYWMHIDMNRDVLYRHIQNPAGAETWKKFVYGTVRKLFEKHTRLSHLSYQSRVIASDYLNKKLAELKGESNE